MLTLVLLLLAAPGLFAAGVKVKKADSKTVCMFMNRALPDANPSVAIDGKTYYYGTENCREKLKADPSLRTAVDPVTHKKVDKATAVVGVTPAGEAVYFESAKTLAEYNAKQ
jgi:YHS domain-containing protein